MKLTIILMSSLFLAAQCMQNQIKNNYSYDGLFYQMAAKAPCFLTHPDQIEDSQIH